MQSLLVQAEVDMLVEHNEVITVLGQLTYWADEDVGLIVTSLRILGGFVAIIHQQCCCIRTISKTVLVLHSISTSGLKLFAVSRYLCLDSSLLLHEFTFFVVILLIQIWLWVRPAWVFWGITETLVYVSVEDIQISRLHPPETHRTVKAVWNFATTAWCGCKILNVRRTVILWQIRCQTVIFFRSCWGLHSCVVLWRACIHRL